MPIDLSAVGKKLEPTSYSYDEKDVILYALGVGAEELEFVYERDLKVLPTFAVVPAFPAMFAMGRVMAVNPAMVLHGEQRLELFGPIPARGTLVTTPTVVGVYDKIKGALIVTEAETVDERGRLLFRNTFGTFARGEGGFGGSRGPAGARHLPPARPPDAVLDMKTSPQQALLYRLSGDRNPLHADPEFARLAGYERPILHGLCTFGIVGRAVLKAHCGNEPALLRALEARFTGVVYPGETIVTEMWRTSPTEVVLQARTRERGDLVVSRARAIVEARP